MDIDVHVGIGGKMSDPKQEKSKRKFKLRLPHVYTIAFLLIVFFAVLT